MDNYFELTFQIDRKRIFEVAYRIVGSNKEPYFSTSGAIFNQPKSDFVCCGQCQDDVICGKSGEYRASVPAADFYKKWDKKHLQKLTDYEYADLLIDIEHLKSKYNYIESQKFAAQRELSKMTPKSTKTHK